MAVLPQHSTARELEQSSKPGNVGAHRQVTPERWAGLNTYVVGVQRWLGVDLPLPVGIGRARIERVMEWLGERNPAKEALAELFLCQLIRALLHLSFAKLGEDIAPEDTEYADFTSWYVGPDGIEYVTGPRAEYSVAPAIQDAAVEEFDHYVSVCLFCDVERQPVTGGEPFGIPTEA